MTPEEKFAAITDASPLGPMLTSTAKEWSGHAETLEALIKEVDKIRDALEAVRVELCTMQRVAYSASAIHMGAASSFALAQWCPKLVGNPADKESGSGQ